MSKSLYDQLIFGEWIEIPSGKVVVSDPCYSLGTWCMISDLDVRKGSWQPAIHRVDLGRWGRRNMKLFLFHEDVNIYETLRKCNRNMWYELPVTVGVDSGQCGIFDSKSYRKGSTIKKSDPLAEYIPIEKPEDKWYSHCCYLTNSSDFNCGNVAGHGVVTSSGIGDGSYRLYACRPDGENCDIVGLYIEFGEHPLL